MDFISILSIFVLVSQNRSGEKDRILTQALEGRAQPPDHRLDLG